MCISLISKIYRCHFAPATTNGSWSFYVFYAFYICFFLHTAIFGCLLKKRIEFETDGDKKNHSICTDWIDSIPYFLCHGTTARHFYERGNDCSCCCCLGHFHAFKYYLSFLFGWNSPDFDIHPHKSHPFTGFFLHFNKLFSQYQLLGDEVHFKPTSCTLQMP